MHLTCSNTVKLRVPSDIDHSNPRDINPEHRTPIPDRHRLLPVIRRHE